MDTKCVGRGASKLAAVDVGFFGVRILERVEGLCEC